MAEFKGFPEGKQHLAALPAAFFEQLLPAIDHLGELKLTAYFLWRLERMEGLFRYLRSVDFLQDQAFMAGLAPTLQQAQSVLEDALERAVSRGTLLKIALETSTGPEQLYFLNSPKGRAAIHAIQSGQWRPELQSAPAAALEARPNIFQLYEQNIGPLTPLIADALGEAEDSYPAEWIEAAVRIAVEKNKRNWRYVSAILERWQREGRHGKKEKSQDRRDSAEDRRRYVTGEFSDFVEH
ncbi:MAG: DnaD domain protein [Chloroflexota bacterium]